MAEVLLCVPMCVPMTMFIHCYNLLFRFCTDNMQIVSTWYLRDVHHEPHFEFERLFMKKEIGTIISFMKIHQFPPES